jgi:hypothetical protein
LARANDDDLLPNLIEGVADEDLVELNLQFRRFDDALSHQIVTAAARGRNSCGMLRVYHPASASDERQIYAPDPNPPRKRPPESPFGVGTVVTIQT